MVFVLWASSTIIFGAEATRLERLKFNNPGLTVDLGVGLWAWPLPWDVDGDGKFDLPVVCSDKPYNGTYLFMNSGKGEKSFPIFKPAKRIGGGKSNVELSFRNGKPCVLTPAMQYPDFLKTGLDNGVKIDLPANVHSNRVRANLWKYFDFNGDGKIDLCVGVGDWTEYGWDNAYDENGNWKNGPLHGFTYIILNKGTDEVPVYEKPFMLLDVDGKPVDVFGMPSPNFADWDGDGDLDLLCGEFLDGFTYFENVGSRTEPKYAKGRRLVTENGKPLTMDLEMITPVAFDWTGNGKLDLICGDEDGRVALIENTGKFKDGAPLFLEPRYFQQEAGELKCGALATPFCIDWDGDGDFDILCGNTAGYLMFFENLSGPGVEFPKWAAPKYLEADGKPIRILAGPNGSIQGPCEAKWGYTTLTAADWDGDGLPDILVNSIWGKIVWYKNIGTRTAPKLAAAQPVEVEWNGPQPTIAWGWLRPNGKELLTQWRTTPVAFDWNNDGLMDLMMLDHEGYFCLFERKKVDDKLVLLPPERCFLNENGEPIRLNDKTAGGSGRRKIAVFDYDDDGAVDFLVNSTNAELWRQVGAKDGIWTFKNLGDIDGRPISGHSTSPCCVDFNGDGVQDVLIGAEDGHLYYLRNRGLDDLHAAQLARKEAAKKRLETETVELAVKAVHTELDTMRKDAKAFANRNYVWSDVPEEWTGFRFLRTHGGESASVTITAKKDTVIRVIAGDGDKGYQGNGWTRIAPNAFQYTDGGKTRMSVYEKNLKQGEVLALPQSGWQGGILLLSSP